MMDDIQPVRLLMEPQFHPCSCNGSDVGWAETRIQMETLVRLRRRIRTSFLGTSPTASLATLLSLAVGLGASGVYSAQTATPQAKKGALGGHVGTKASHGEWATAQGATVYVLFSNATEVSLAVRPLSVDTAEVSSSISSTLSSKRIRP